MFTISTNGIYFGHWGWITEVIAAVMIAAGLWKIFVKAGDKGWKGVIPFYNSYIVFKLVWKVKFFFAEMLMLSAAVILDFWEPYSAQFFVIVLFIAVFVVGVIQKSKLSHDCKDPRIAQEVIRLRRGRYAGTAGTPRRGA